MPILLDIIFGCSLEKISNLFVTKCIFQWVHNLVYNSGIHWKTFSRSWEFGSINSFTSDPPITTHYGSTFFQDFHRWMGSLRACVCDESTKRIEERGQCKMQTADYCSNRHEQHGGSVVFLQLCGNLPPTLCNIQYSIYQESHIWQPNRSAFSFWKLENA